MTAPRPPARLVDARRRLDDATRASRTAAVAARGAFDRRARRRRRTLTVAVFCSVALLAIAAAVLVAVSVATSNQSSAADRQRDVLAAASSAVAAMLTANPNHAVRYADSVIALSTGAQRDRLVAGRTDLITEIGRQQRESTGVVLSAGLITDPGDDADATADVLLVAEATNPALIGGDPTTKRMPIALTMRLVDGVWKVEKAGLQ